MARGLTLDLRVGERVALDDGRITLVLEHKSGARARIRIEADASIAIGTAATRRSVADASEHDARGACAAVPV